MGFPSLPLRMGGGDPSPEYGQVWGRHLDGQEEVGEGEATPDNCGLSIRWGPPTEGNS